MPICTESGIDDARDAAALLIAPRQKARPSRAADGTAGVKIGKPHTLAGKLIEPGGLKAIVTITTQVGIAQVISQNHNDVGRGRDLVHCLRRGIVSKE